MCGITGILHPDAGQYLPRMGAQLAHRGPDGSGAWVSGNIGLGHRRLAVQDLSDKGHQPMFSADGRYAIVYNGEIYNHWALRESLQTRHVFQSTCDAETLLYGYIEHGADLLNRLNGMFAFAIVDTHTRELFMARDPFGIKPLYYYAHNQTFLFASEIKALLAFDGLDRSLEAEAWVNYLTFLWSPGETTPFRHVRKLPPGHLLRVKAAAPDAVQIERYYQLPFSGQYSDKSESVLADELENLLLEAVERQLLSDVPFGFFLSGGLDSSAIVALARRLRPKAPLRCYTIDTGEAATTREGFTSDLPYARQVAAHLKADLSVVPADLDLMRDFDQMVWHLDEPQADPASLNVLRIAANARRAGDVVLLGGTGGDDLFSGYRRHQALYWESYIQQLPLPLRRCLRQSAQYLKPRRPFFRRLQKFALTLGQPSMARRMGFYGWLPLETTRSLFAPAIQQQIADYDPFQVLEAALREIPAEQSPLNQMLFWEIKYFLGDHTLNYTDKMGMALGVEIRVPFLDPALVAFSAALPPSLKMKGTTTKYLLRKVMEKYLPKPVVYRAKAGFTAPIRQWLNQDLQESVAAKLSPERLARWNIFDPAPVQALMQASQKGEIDGAYPIFALLAIQSWLEQFTP